MSVVKFPKVKQNRIVMLLKGPSFDVYSRDEPFVSFDALDEARGHAKMLQDKHGGEARVRIVESDLAEGTPSIMQAYITAFKLENPNASEKQQVEHGLALVMSGQHEAFREAMLRKAFDDAYHSEMPYLRREEFKVIKNDSDS